MFFKEAMLQKFPFLERYVNKDLAEMRLEQIDFRLLCEKPFVAFSFFGRVEYSKFILLDAQGNHVTSVGKLTKVISPRKFLGFKVRSKNVKKYFRERVGEALDRIDEPVKFILKINRLRDEDGDYLREYDMTLFFVPDGTTAQEYMCILIEKEDTRIQAEKEEKERKQNELAEAEEKKRKKEMERTLKIIEDSINPKRP